MFTSIFNVMQENQALNLNLMRTGEKLVVCFQPLATNTSEATGSNLTPLVITATPEELDADFISAICSPLQERFSMLVNMEEFKKSTQKAQPKTPVKNTVTVDEGGSSEKIAAPKKSRKEEQIEEAEKLFKAANLPGAYGIYKKLYEQDKTDTKIGNRMHEIWAKMSQRSVFSEENTAVVDEAPKTEIKTVPTTEEEPNATAVENKESEVDMFAQFLNPSKVENQAPVKDEIKPNPVPPGVDPEQYLKFLQYQEFMKAQQVTETV